MTTLTASFAPHRGDNQKRYPPLQDVSRTHIATDEAAHYLNRAPQTLRMWACFETGPIQPIRVCGRLGWPVAGIRHLLGLA